jgi:hypothetical protein
MDKNKRKEAKLLYKETKSQAGIYQIKNIINGKILVESMPDLRSLEGKRFQLSIGRHNNEGLQTEWKTFGEPAFLIEILEKLKEKDDPAFDREAELKKLKDKWLDLIKPFGDKGYNS